MLRICVISDYDSIFAFKAENVDTFAVHNKREVCECLHRLLSGRYEIIYITENFFDVIYDDCMKYNAEMMPNVKSIPIFRGKDRKISIKEVYGIENGKTFVKSA